MKDNLMLFIEEFLHVCYFELKWFNMLPEYIQFPQVDTWRKQNIFD